MLQGLAYHMPHINSGQTSDTGDSYYWSMWGAGIALRYPLLTPKVSYAAMATLTQQLDRARYVRFLETGSPTLFCMEFRVPGGYAYTLWLPRGKRDVTLAFHHDVEVRHVNMVGAERELCTAGARLRIEVSESPCYLTTPARVMDIDARPTRLPVPAPDVRVVEPWPT